PDTLSPFRFSAFSGRPTPPISTLSLHDALPIFTCPVTCPLIQHRTIEARESRAQIHRFTAGRLAPVHPVSRLNCGQAGPTGLLRSEEHTSELQSRENLVCRLLLEKKKRTTDHNE